MNEPPCVMLEVRSKKTIVSMRRPENTMFSGRAPQSILLFLDFQNNQVFSAGPLKSNIMW